MNVFRVFAAFGSIAKVTTITLALISPIQPGHAEPDQRSIGVWPARVSSDTLERLPDTIHVQPGLQVESRTGQSQAEPGAVQLVSDPATRTLLAQVENAYRSLSAATMSGDLSVVVELAQESHKSTQNFTSSFSQPNHFRHQVKPGVLLGCDGVTGYAFDDKENAYLRFQYPDQKGPIEKLPMVVLRTLQMQNPSLLFALTQSPLKDFTGAFGAVKRVGDQVIDNTNCPVLQFGADADPHKVTLLIDPKTHLIRRFILDFTTALAKTGRSGVKDAMIMIDYTRVALGSVPNSEFAWSPPTGAVDVRELARATEDKE